jgi:hypothetical protein
VCARHRLFLGIIVVHSCAGKMRALDLSDEMLARMFDSVDVDASGYIDISEFTAWLAFSAARSPRFAHARTANARVSSPASPGREALSPRVVHTRRPPNTDPAHSSRTRGLVAGNESKTAFEEKDEEQRGRGELLARARRGKHRGSVESEAGETAGEQSEPERRLNSSRENQRTAGGEESDPEQLDQPYVGDRSAEEDNISGNLQAEENFDDDADRQSKDEGEEEVREGEAIDSVGQRRRGRHQVFVKLCADETGRHPSLPCPQPLRFCRFVLMKISNLPTSGSAARRMQRARRENSMRRARARRASFKMTRWSVRIFLSRCRAVFNDCLVRRVPSPGAQSTLATPRPALTNSMWRVMAADPERVPESGGGGSPRGPESAPRRVRHLPGPTAAWCFPIYRALHRLDPSHPSTNSHAYLRWCDAGP